MLDFKDRSASVLVATALICCLCSGRQSLRAQKRDVGVRPLVVVADHDDVNCVRRLGGTAVAVSSLFTVRPDGRNYGRCATRVKALRRFSVYVGNAASHCRYECFWRERLVSDNPRGQVVWIANRTRSVQSGWQVAARKAIEVHRALASALPQHRHIFDANLAVELDRLRRAQIPPATVLAGNPRQPASPPGRGKRIEVAE